MTAPERESQILAMLEALRFAKPRDMDELTAWVSAEDTAKAGDTAISPASFPRVTLTLSPYDIVCIADGEKE